MGCAVAKIVGLNPLRSCGKRSYSVYLIHLPVCTVGNAALAYLGLSAFWPRALVMVPVVTAASVAAGYLFYNIADRRFTSLPSLGAWRTKFTPASRRSVVAAEA